LKNNIYVNQLIRQVENSHNPGVRTYLRWLYSKVEIPLSSYSNILEIGAGAGISKNFLCLTDVLRTDLLEFEAQGVMGNIDAQSLPFHDESFGAVFGIDMLHHAPYPYKVLAESIRVVKAQGLIIFVEPYVSVLSYLFYKIFHDEKTYIRLKIDPLIPAISDQAADGNQIICQNVFFSRGGKKLLESQYQKRVKIHRTYLSPLAFFATGGINRPLNTPPKLIKLLIDIENKAPQFLLKFFGARQIVIIQKL
jgi:SAM-dependent methyltransferase